MLSKCYAIALTLDPLIDFVFGPRLSVRTD